MLRFPRRRRNLAIVLSPFQLICAQEAREKFCQGERNDLVIVDRRGPETPEYIQKQAELDGGWNKVVRVAEPERRGFRRFIIRLKNTGILLIRLGMGKGKVFLGDPYLNWFRILGNIFGDEVVWLDDGAASINVIEKFERKGLLQGPNETTPKFFSVFSSPDLERRTNGALMQNDLTLKRQCRNPKQTVSPKQAIFIGQWLSERSGVEQDEELHTFATYLKEFPDWEFTYISHRHESPAKLAEIAKLVPVKRFDRSIETALLESDTVPEMIVSWYSTALFTLKRLFPDVKVQAFQVPLTHSKPLQRSEWMRVYKVLDQQGVPIMGYLPNWQEMQFADQGSVDSGS